MHMCDVRGEVVQTVEDMGGICDRRCGVSGSRGRSLYQLTEDGRAAGLRILLEECQQVISDKDI